MIECEECGRCVHPDEIQRCPECDAELCGECYQKHVKRCLNDNDDSDED